MGVVIWMGVMAPTWFVRNANPRSPQPNGIAGYPTPFSSSPTGLSYPLNALNLAMNKKNPSGASNRMVWGVRQRKGALAFGHFFYLPGRVKPAKMGEPARAKQK